MGLQLETFMVALAIFLVGIAAFLILTPASELQPKATPLIAEPVKGTPMEMNGHSFLFFTNSQGETISVVHDPDCKHETTRTN